MNIVISLFVGLFVLYFAQFATKTGKFLGFIRVPFYVFASSIRDHFKYKREKILRHYDANPDLEMERDVKPKIDALANYCRLILSINKYIATPFYRCIFCMANGFTWGLVAYGISFEFGLVEIGIGWWLSYCITLSGFAIFMDKLLGKLGVHVNVN